MDKETQLRTSEEFIDNRRAIASNGNREIQFRPYNLWVGTLPEKDTIITLHFENNWVKCLLGISTESHYFWTKKPQESNLKIKTWNDFFSETGIIENQEFQVKVEMNNNYYLSPIEEKTHK
jgi:hypothetical protein